MNPVYLNDKASKRAEREEKFRKKKASRSEYVDELRKEIYDMPEERTGFIDTGSRKAFMREQKNIEQLEMENMKRKSLTKAEKKKWKQQTKDITERIDKFDDLKDLEDIIGSH